MLPRDNRVQQCRGRHVHHHSHASGRDHDPAIDRMLREKPGDRFVNEIQARHHEHRQVDERADDLRAAIAECAPLIRRQPANPPGHERDDKRAAIAQVMERIGQQGQAPRKQAGNHLDDRQQQVQHERDTRAGGRSSSRQRANDRAA